MTTPTTAASHTPPSQTILHTALTLRRPVRASYHGHDRLLCPHALGYHNGRAKVLCYQTQGTTSHGPLPADPRQRWRWMFIDELHDLHITHDPWKTAENYSPTSQGIDQLIACIPPQPRP